MKMNKDMKEREDKGIKRKTSHQVSKGGGSNRQRNVKQKVKGEEEEEEWDEEEKWDEDEGDEEENRKVKKGQKREGVKGKTGQPKQEKVEPKRGMQYRSSLNTVVKLLQTILNGEFTTRQIQEIKKTPFADIVFGIVEAKLDEAYVLPSELEPNDEEEELYRFCPVTEHDADVKDSEVKTTVDKSNDEVVQDTSDEEADSDQNEVVTLRGEIVGEKESKGKKVDAGREEHEIQNVEEEEEEEEEEGGGFETVQDEGGPEHVMVQDAKVDSTTAEAYTSILECGTPKRKRGKTKVKVKSSSLTRGVKKTFTRVEKRLDDYVYVDLKKGATNKSKQKWNPSEAPLIHLLRNTDANLLRQIVDCSDTDLYCTVWTNDVTREAVPLEDIMKLLQGGDVSNWMIDGLAHMLTIHLDHDDKLTHHVAFFPCTIWTILLNENSDMRTVLLDTKLQRVFENVRQHGTKYYRYLVFPMNGSGGKSLKMSPYHWTILFFDVRKQKWMHYNSLKKRDGRDPMLKDATFVKKYVENYMKDRHDELKNQSTSTEILFQEQNFHAPICSPPYAPQQENTSVDCGVFVCKLMELLAYIEPIPKTLPKTEIDQFRADLVSRFLNDEGRSWTIKKWEARRMGKGSQ
ncbi:hypothetical protein RHGRI_014289 [Rhododendron griersonianum]|uniref:Ubiquitin-like protease family profile domain-containing protein n=1 Tax=Rhododendron griersonianum TaxID=479676 RepID=A0AAV6K8T7_9ERIC|nr:hypothetical protein RHGRI_014289 [Rhododendron griersonianum]